MIKERAEKPREFLSAEEQSEVVFEYEHRTVPVRAFPPGLPVRKEASYLARGHLVPEKTEPTSSIILFRHMGEFSSVDGIEESPRQ
jgi:hypothetical protein